MICCSRTRSNYTKESSRESSNVWDSLRTKTECSSSEDHNYNEVLEIHIDEPLLQKVDLQRATTCSSTLSPASNSPVASGLTTVTSNLKKITEQREKLLQAAESSSDEDDSFGRSISKTLKKQKNRKRKAKIKAKIWQVLAEYEEDSDS